MAFNSPNKYETYCNQTPNSITTKDETCHHLLSDSFDKLPLNHSSVVWTTPLPDSTNKNQADIKSIKIFNKTLYFSLEINQNSSNLAFRIPTFISEPTDHSFLRITSPSSFQFVKNVKSEFGIISENDTCQNYHAVSITLRNLNNLEVQKKVRTGHFDILHRNDFKKIRKFGVRPKFTKEVVLQKLPGFQFQEKIQPVLIEKSTVKLGDFGSRTQFNSMVTNQNTLSSENKNLEEPIKKKTIELSKRVEIESSGKDFKFECKVPHF